LEVSSLEAISRVRSGTQLKDFKSDFISFSKSLPVKVAHDHDEARVHTPHIECANISAQIEPEKPYVPRHRSIKHLIRRECYAFENAVTGDKDYLLEFCEDYLPDLAECQAHLKEGCWIDNPDKIPIYYTGWPKEDNTLD
jgi:hypothetical protein